ncbi:putative HTH-type transcriptional regulator YusO [Burkholderiales bacterium]|nr:putative HTH-type transcriptional regulator YusO [Burkholderiales bacterium]
MRRSERSREAATTDEAEALTLMRLVHLIEAANQDRATSSLDLRQRLVIQGLGLWGPTPIAAVGQRLGVSPSTMTGLADRLERGGYVERCRHPSDRRATVLALTRKGHRAFEGEKEYYKRLIAQALAQLDAGARGLVLRALAELPWAHGTPPQGRQETRGSDLRRSRATSRGVRVRRP